MEPDPDLNPEPPPAPDADPDAFAFSDSTERRPPPRLLIDGSTLIDASARPRNVPEKPDPPPTPPPRHDVRLMEGPSPDFDDVEDSPRRARLRAAALVFLAESILHLARNYEFCDVVPGSVLVAQGFLVLILAVLGLGLAPRFRPGARQLDAAELILFGGGTLLLMTAYFSLAVAMSARPDVNEFDWMSRDIVRALVGLIVMYGLLIPNPTPWLALRAALMAAAPFATLGLVALAYPGRTRPLFAELGQPVQVSGTLMLVITGVLLAVYGHHVIQGLRRDVFEARRFGQYRLGTRLGGGGMGEVFLAQHALLRRPAALKRIRPAIADDPATLARFEREVQATARLTHPNTVAIYDFGRASDGSFFYVMEYLRGLDLASIVDRHGPLEPARVIHLLRQACGALSEAHAAGLIHRDLKPANLFAAILGGEYDVVKLLDFGMVKQQVETPDMPDLSREGRIRGTPLYMAPEQVRGHTLDGRADLYAMGCVAFSLLTGHPPFQADDSVQVMIAHAVHPVPSPRSLRPDLPDDLDAVIIRCLSKDPDQRFPDAAALAHALGQCACAPNWDADRARAWWAAREPNA